MPERYHCTEQASFGGGLEESNQNGTGISSVQRPEANTRVSLSAPAYMSVTKGIIWALLF